MAITPVRKNSGKIRYSMASSPIVIISWYDTGCLDALMVWHEICNMGYKGKAVHVLVHMNVNTVVVSL